MPNIREVATQDDIAGLIAGLQELEGALLPILHAVQTQCGHVPQSAIPLIADALNISRAEVHGVVSFYHDFRAEPAGQHVLKICRAEACQAIGAEQLANDILAELGIDWSQTCLLYTSPSPRDTLVSRMPSSA